MSLTHGQLDGRAARIQKTSDWLGATPMTDFGEVIAEDTGEYEPNIELVHQTVQQIRVALQTGHGCVRCGERHRATAILIAQQLTDEERRHVIFDLDNVLPPEASDVADLAPCPDRPNQGRDLIRPREPNVARVEDGTLRPT